ncbi:MAG: YfbU family protein [Armatimonadota bacterium]
MTRYRLFIYEPDSTVDILASYESDQPFSSLSAGALLTPLGGGAEDMPRLLEVTGLEHIVRDTEGIVEVDIGVYTRALDNVGESRASRRLRLTRKDRWIISNQLRILEMLTEDEYDKENLTHAREAIEHGYELEYDWSIQYIYEDAMTVQECTEVLDILEMFETLERSFEQLEDKRGVEKFDGEHRFAGWDGNNEGKQLSYARHFCEGRSRFESLGERAWMNSHMPTLSRYRAMLKAFRPIWNKKVHEGRYALTAEEITEVLEGWRKERERLNREHDEFRRRPERD